MKTLIPRTAGLAVLLLVAVAATSEAQLEWRLSVKFILDANGNMPSTTATFGDGCCDVILNSRAAVEANVAHANGILDAHGRGYRLVLDEVRSLANVSQWFNANARSDTTRDQLETAATSNPTLYGWRTDAINLYINNSVSGYCSRPTDSRSLIIVGSGAYDTLLLHEIGHYFNLIHTFQGEQYRDANNADCDLECACAFLIGGNGDEVFDTLADHQCWTRAQIAANNPGASDLQVDNVFRNVMSYHLSQDRFTAGQLDRMTDASNGPRFNVTTGRTWFVDRANSCLQPAGGSGCTTFGFGGPLTSIMNGINAATPGDIMIIRAGNYNERTTFTKPVTLRATRGNVSIGRP